MGSTTPLWKKNLFICCIASFIVSVGMSQMAPILPLYIAELGIDDPADVARWSGIVFGCNFISLAIFSPIWGRLSDRLGRKPMILRASGWLGLIMIGMGFAQSVWHLVILRLLQGCLSGFVFRGAVGGQYWYPQSFPARSCFVAGQCPLVPALHLSKIKKIKRSPK